MTEVDSLTPPSERQVRGRLLAVVGVAGEILLTLGLVILLFVIFEIFGSSYIAGKHQATLRSSLAPSLHTTTKPTIITHAPVPAPPSTSPTPSGGTPIAILSIPEIGLNTVVIQGAGTLPLERGPGHYPLTPMPGQAGNVAIAGHRTTWGRPFYNLDRLRTGSKITLASPQGSFTYEVRKIFVVDPNDGSVLEPTVRPSLTLTTCNPRFSASTRLVARAVMVGSSLTPANKVIWPKSAAPEPPPDPTPAWILGIVSLLVLAATLVLGRLLRRGWIAFLVGVPVSVVVLMLFFTAVTPFLPANL